MTDWWQSTWHGADMVARSSLFWRTTKGVYHHEIDIIGKQDLIFTKQIRFTLNTIINVFLYLTSVPNKCPERTTTAFNSQQKRRRFLLWPVTMTTMPTMTRHSQWSVSQHGNQWRLVCPLGSGLYTVCSGAPQSCALHSEAREWKLRCASDQHELQQQTHKTW